MLEINQTLGGWERNFTSSTEWGEQKQGITWVSKQPHCSFLIEEGMEHQHRIWIGLCLAGLKQSRAGTVESILISTAALKARAS